jgi:hypothetical protein
LTAGGRFSGAPFVIENKKAKGLNFALSFVFVFAFAFAKFAHCNGKK